MSHSNRYRPDHPLTAMSLAALAALCLCARGANAATYYVAPTGSDAAAGSSGRPFRSITRAVSRAQAGDIVTVQAGTYAEAVVLPASGVAGRPIVLRAQAGVVMTSPNPAASLSAFDLGTHAYITIDGFELGGGYDETVYLRPGAHDVQLSRLYIHDNHTGIWIAGAANVTVRSCMIAHNFRTGIRIFAGAHAIRVMDSHSESNDDGAQCDGESDGINADSTTADIELDRVTVAANSQDGIDLKATGVVLRQVTANGNNCSAVKLSAGGDLQNVVVTGSTVGVNLAGNTRLLNVTVCNNATGIRAVGGGYSLNVVNTVVSGIGKALVFGANVTVLEHHNIFYRPGHGDPLIEKSGVATYSADAVNSGAWARASRQGDDTFAADPRLQAGNCEPLNRSPAIDSADDGAAPAVDLLGTPRPVGTTADRGAFERPRDSSVEQIKRTAAPAAVPRDSDNVVAVHAAAPKAAGRSPRRIATVRHH